MFKIVWLIDDVDFFGMTDGVMDCFGITDSVMDFLVWLIIFMDYLVWLMIFMDYLVERLEIQKTLEKEMKTILPCL